jgi:hypothetical protein
MSSSEITSWMAYYSTRPMKEDIERYENAYTRQIIAEFSGRTKRKISIDDCVLKFGSEAEDKQSQALIHKNISLLKLSFTRPKKSKD